MTSNHTRAPWRKNQYGELRGPDSQNVTVWGDGIAHGQRSAETEANGNLIGAAADMYEALEQIQCPDCEHTLGEHADKYGCEHELGDRQVGEVGAVAMGPCGCKGILLSDDLQRCLGAIRKARGLQ